MILTIFGEEWINQWDKSRTYPPKVERDRMGVPSVKDRRDRVLKCEEKEAAIE